MSAKQCIGVFVFGSKGHGCLSGLITAITKGAMAWEDCPTHAGDVAGAGVASGDLQNIVGNQV